MRRIAGATLVLLLSTFVLAPTAGRAATDVTAAGQGNGTFVYNSPAITCTGPVAVAIDVHANVGNFVEAWGPGSPGIEACALGTPGFAFATNAYPPVRQCVPGFGGIQSAPHTLSQSGTTYTFQASATSCGGRSVLDKIVITVKPSQIVFTHTYSENGVQLIKASGTLARVA